MKKLGIIITLCFLLLLSACGEVKVDENVGSIEFYFPTEYLEYVPYKEVPRFTFEFKGTLYTSKDVSKSNYKYFSRNDDFAFSEIISEFLKSYEEKDRVTYRLVSKDTQFETKMNKLILNDKGELKQKTQVMKVKDGEVYNEIAYINLENGLTISIDYRRFISDFEGEYKTYYAWRYAAPISMVLHYPLMLHTKNNGEKTFLIVPLPPKVMYHIGVSRQLPLEKLINKDEYFKENYRRFYYPDYTSDPTEKNDFDRNVNIQKVKDYYKRDLNGREINGKFYFSYLGYDFEVVFEEQTFLINIVS